MDNQKKILIIDDEEDVLTYLSTFFSDNNFQVISAADGKAGIQKAISEQPDIITLDISMPEESGVRALRELQNDKNTRAIPIIIITGLVSDFKRFIGNRRQVRMPEGYFEKPIDREKLLQKVLQLLKN